MYIFKKLVQKGKKTDLFEQPLKEIKGTTPRLDVMIEAKQKDVALFQLMKELIGVEHVQIKNQACVIIPSNEHTLV